MISNVFLLLFIFAFTTSIRETLCDGKSRRSAPNSAPFFNKSLYVVNIPEEKEKGYVVAKLTAVDPEKTEIIYSLSAYTDARSQSMFTIDSLSGVVTTSTRLDRELLDLHYLKITATDSGTPQMTGTAVLQINVVDENDHAPIFEKSSYETSVRESVPVGTVIFNVRATDEDAGVNAEIEYKIINQTGTNEAFKIDSKTGVITTHDILDRESIPIYYLEISASDMASPLFRKNSKTTLKITILDENDNFPQFLNRSYSVSVPEDIDWRNHPVITSISAIDSDERDNAAIRYSIYGGNTQKCFNIDSRTGEISVIAPLDYERDRSYRLNVRAQDAGSPPRSNTTVLLINVEDMNDHEPKFLSPMFQQIVPENTRSGSNILRVQAYDEDSGHNSQLTFSIKNLDNRDLPFAINPDNGWITSTRHLDWEEKSVYEFSVVARDNGNPPNSASVNVEIRVQDVNDNDPTFQPKVYEASLSEVDPIGTSVVTLFASDPDQNARLTFQISDGNHNGKFAISSEKNQAQITLAQSLDYKSERGYILKIEVVDDGGRSDTATVHINVTDANTHRPVFGKTTYLVTVPEDTPIDATILVVEATDGDSGENARITYHMESTPEFRIDPITGAIITVMQLDRESKAGHTLVVTATDHGTPSLSDSTNVEIEVLDVNDNSPKFKESSYQASINENLPAGTRVIQISATDIDAGINGQVKYTFEGGNSGEDAFVVDEISGIVRTNKILDRESVAKYDLTLYAVDNGIPRRSTPVSILVTVKDVNDNPPRFESDRLRYYVPENSPIGSIVGEIKAVDIDDGVNAKIDYSIVGGIDAKSFDLQYSKNGVVELITKTEMDFESPKRQYSLILRASSLPLRNDVDIEIHVTDVNDNPPILKDFSIIFNNHKNYFPFGIIGKVPVFDADVSDKLNFKFMSGNRAGLLIMNETTGELRLSPSLNTNVPTKALFEINVSDGINEVSALCQLSVNLVTDSMLSNSVTLSIKNLEIDELLSTVYDKLLDGIAAVVPASKENIAIFNAQAEKNSEKEFLNVAFSVRVADSRDPDLFYPTQYLQERIYLSRLFLVKVIGYDILPFENSLCVREPCSNYEQCVSVVKFGNASDFIASETLLFRAIHPLKTFACRCPYGFTGMYHRYECDTEINLCYSNPCLNGGTCERQESGYVCLCLSGFVGKNCELNMQVDNCVEDLCKSGSECVNIKNYPKDLSRLPEIKGFQCANCTYVEWSSPTCELLSRSFVKGSYLSFSAINQRHRINIKLRFATRKDNILLIYNGRFNEEHDYMALEILDSTLVFSFSLGSTKHQVSLSARPGYLSSGLWRTVEVDFYNYTATLTLHNCDRNMMRNFYEDNAFSDKVCSNNTKVLLDEKCRDSMQSCYRYFDLNGPLQIGGLPPLLTKFPTTADSFVGCISQLFLNHKLIDLNSYVANNGTFPGCEEKRNFCQSHPCMNGGTCVESWSTYSCRCMDGFLGKDCAETNHIVKHFSGSSYLIFVPKLLPISTPWLIKLSFKTFKEDGLILKLDLSEDAYVIIDIKLGILRYTFTSKTVEVAPIKVNDGEWHNLEANWMGSGIWLNLDYNTYESNQEFTRDIRGLFISKAFVGGVSLDEDSTPSSIFDDDQDYAGFDGCIQGLDIGNGKDSWLNPLKVNFVRDGCFFDDPCATNPCPVQSECINKGLGKHECKCNPSYIGPNCDLVCNLEPCSQGSTCVPWTNEKGYKCLCDSFHTGFNCEIPIEDRCPANWWGPNPLVCGPCNCNLEKGYDDHCNQTTGECRCLANHYQPIGSSICLNCECYTQGSESNRCDPITGQCRCKPGVFGRQCDSCASSLAEVTPLGCEVIYNGCPKSFSNAIWWDRTSLKTETIQECPPGSFGKAKRYCDEAQGWLEPDLFDCTSNAFADLREQLVFLEKEKFPLTTYSAIKFAHDLKNVVNSTSSLYGSDVMIASRLIHHLLSFEIMQKGLNLTHKQDRYYLNDLLFVANEILEPSHVQFWSKIAQIIPNGGPDHLLYLFDEYTKTLIENLEDTFTDPFEIALKNIILGIDVIGMDSSKDEQSDSVKSNSYINELTHAPHYKNDFKFDNIPAMSIPKYNNYPRRKKHLDHITEVIIPLKLLDISQDLNTSNFDKSHKYGNLYVSHEPIPRAIFGYIIYSSMDQLLPHNFDPSVKHRFGTTIKLNTPLFSLAIKPANSKKFLDKNLRPKILVKLRTLVSDGFTNPQCGYWTHSISKSNNHRGKWSTRGCELTGVYPPRKLRKSYIYINCTCDRIASYGVLMDMTASKIYFEESILLSMVNISFTCVSLSVLLLTLIILSIIRGVQTNSNSIHRNIVLSLLLSQLLYAFSMALRNNLTQNGFSCTLIAIFLHYFYLAQFSWIFVESVHLYRMLTEIRDINHGPMRFYYFLGYALPAIIVSLTVGVKADQYGHYLFCWLSLKEAIIWSMLAPISLFMFFSIIVLILALRVSIQIKETVSDYGNLKVLLWLSIVLLPVLGFNWILALIASNETSEELSYGYIMLSTFSALYVFIGYCLVNKRVRHNLKITWYRLKGMKISHLEESMSGTKTSMGSRVITTLQNPNFGALSSNIRFGISTSSTTSRSTRTSSSPYRSGHNCGGDDAVISDTKRHRKHRRHHNHHHRHHISESESEVYSHRSLELASSHSSDEEDSHINTPRQNQINSLREQSLVEEDDDQAMQSIEDIRPMQMQINSASSNESPTKDVTRLSV